MGKIINQTRQVRLNHQAKTGKLISISQIARKLGVTRSYLSNIERGTAWPNEAVLCGLCELYDVQVGDLLVYEPVDDSPVGEAVPADESAT